MTNAPMERSGLRIAPVLADFIERKVLPGTGLDPTKFWEGTADILQRFTPENRALLETRDQLQRRIDDWLADRPTPPTAEEHRTFLTDLGYLVPEPAPFTIQTGIVDDEVGVLAGPQLVVPALNARFLLNAANARWGSLYDALYGSDALGTPPPAEGYDRDRGARVIDWAKAFLDDAVPLASGSWREFKGGDPALRDASQFVGRRDENLLLRNNGLHIEIVVDRDHRIGRDDPAGISDVVLESALSTIVDLEDSIAAVDADDKVAAYANWLGLMKGDLVAEFEKDGVRTKRTLARDRHYVGLKGEHLVARGRSLLFVRNVGHLMTTSAVMLRDGSEAPEGILDAIVTSTIALHDIRGGGKHANSRTGSIYIVKPKLHGPDEAAFTDRLFDAVEDLLGLDRHTIKIGVMDEERRTSANLKACIAAVARRIAFINTGFLDRTGDEIRTSMAAGPMLPKNEIRSTPWIAAYEDRNVQIGLACGFAGRAQIGKGMWAAPDRMADMLAQKVTHPSSGATTAWVPSPTAATLHATHYHRVDVRARQLERSAENVAPLADLLTPPLASGRNWSSDEIRSELENNAQGILGYVVRWIDQGIGCSKVPDISDIGLMEDRATLRISAQHMANWLRHGVCTPEEADDALERMAFKVDVQNHRGPAYRNLLGKSGARSLAFQAARALVFEGAAQPNGYTEPLLHRFRARIKADRGEAAFAGDAGGDVSMGSGPIDAV